MNPVKVQRGEMCVRKVLRRSRTCILQNRESVFELVRGYHAAETRKEVQTVELNF